MDDKQLHDIWEVELSLLEKLKSICEKYGLRYCASAGTLLGAVRHKGFIPWDDDIDISMMWSDYKVFMEVAPKECQYPFFYQCPYTEPEALAGASRLRRSDTTGFTKWEHENVGPEYDRGIFIDIFPMFYVPDLEEERIRQKEQVMFYWKAIRGHDALVFKEKTGMTSQAYDQYIPEYLEYCRSLNGSPFDIVKLKERYLEVCAWGNKRSKEVGGTSTKCHVRRSMWDTEWFESYIELPFENTTICCPSQYDKVLERHFGDWRTPVMGPSDHEMYAADAHIPWREFDLTAVENG